jgi:hypothetical protein
MANANEGVMRRRQADPAYVGYLSTRQEAGPKGNGSWPGLPLESQAAFDTEPGVRHQPDVVQSGYTERWNRPALSVKAE